MDAAVTGQAQEMEMVRQRIVQLEQAHMKMKTELAPRQPYPSLEKKGFVFSEANKMDVFNSYETEIRILRHELESRGVQTIPTHIGAPTQHAGPSQAPPPALGHGPSNLFGGIMANQGGSGPGLAPPPPQDQQPPQYTLQQPVAAAQQGAAPPPPQGSFGGYPPGAAVNGMCDFLFPLVLRCLT